MVQAEWIDMVSQWTGSYQSVFDESAELGNLQEKQREAQKVGIDGGSMR